MQGGSDGGTRGSASTGQAEPQNGDAIAYRDLATHPAAPIILLVHGNSSTPAD